MRTRTLALLFAATSLVTLGGAALAAEPAPKPQITIHDVLARREPSTAQLGFDGVTPIASVKDPAGAWKIVAWVKGQREDRLAGEWPAYSPDGKWLFFLRDQTWVLRDLATGAERNAEAGKPPILFTGPVWSPDSRYVAANFDLRDAVRKITPQITSEDGVRVEDLGETQKSAQHALWNQNGKVLTWQVSAAAPKLTPIDDFNGYAGAWGVSAEGRNHTYYYTTGIHGIAGQEGATVARALTVETGAVRELYRSRSHSQAAHPQVSPDGKTLAFALDLDTPRYGVLNDIVAVDLTTGQSRRLTHERSVSGLAWGADGNIYYVARGGGLQQLWRVGLDGQEHQLTHDALNRVALHASAGGRLLDYEVESGEGAKDIRTWTVSTSKEAIVGTVADPAATYQLATFRPVTWPLADGGRVHGFLFLPPGFSANRKYPLIVDIHGGGPNTPLMFDSYFGIMSRSPLGWHALAELGYVVFCPDYRSSGEYSSAINISRTLSADGDSERVADDFREIEAGVTWLVGQGYIDAKRIAVFGHSAGGQRGAYLLTHTHLFSAGILHDPGVYGPQAELLEKAHLLVPVDWAGQEPLTDSQRAAQTGGYLFDGFRNRTPTLLMVGNPALDAIDPSSTEMMFSMMRSMHTPVRYLRFLDEGHNASTVAGFERGWTEMKAWLDKYAPAGPLP